MIPNLPAHEIERCKSALTAAWPGVKILKFAVHVTDWDRDAATFDYAGVTGIHCRISASEPLLVALGILTREDVNSIPPCGACRRRGRHICRRKSRTGVEFMASDDWADDFDDLGLFASVLVPALWYRPAQAA